MELAESILLITKLIGTIAFAVSGALVAIDKQFDIFGAMVLGVIAAVGGGVLRDILLGITPPLIFKEYLFVTVAFTTSFFVFWFEYFRTFNKHKTYYLQVINMFDAVGLGVFTVIGVNTALLYGHGDNWFLVVFIGTTTGISGGVMRDVLAGRIPMVLRKQVYALASITGALIFYILYHTELDLIVAMFFSIAVVVLIRLLAMYFKWSLPRVPQ